MLVASRAAGVSRPPSYGTPEALPENEKRWQNLALGSRPKVLIQTSHIYTLKESFPLRINCAGPAGGVVAQECWTPTRPTAVWVSDLAAGFHTSTLSLSCCHSLVKLK